MYPSRPSFLLPSVNLQAKLDERADRSNTRSELYLYQRYLEVRDAVHLQDELRVVLQFTHL